MADLRLYCFAVCAFTPTGGGGFISILLSSSPSGSWDDYHGGTVETDDWVGVVFAPALVDQLDFTEGDVFSDGGWFTAEPTIEYFDGSTWSPVSGQVCTPTYDNSGSTGFESYSFTFDPVACKGLRLRGSPGGSNYFISAQSITPQGTLIGDQRAGSGVTRISAFTSTGSGQPLTAINDGMMSDWLDQSNSLAWDDYHGGTVETDDWVGYTYSSDYLWSALLFVTGGTYYDGGTFTAEPTIEVRVGGTWTAVSSQVLLTDAGRGKGVGGPPSTTYDPSFGSGFPGSGRILFLFDPIIGDGIRIRGAPNGSAYFISSEEIVPVGVEPVEQSPALFMGNTTLLF